VHVDRHRLSLLAAAGFLGLLVLDICTVFTLIAAVVLY